MAFTASARLEQMRGVLFAIKSYESHGRDHPAVFNAVVSSLIDLGDIAATLPPEVTDSEPGVRWDAIRDLRRLVDEDAESLQRQVWPVVDGLLPLTDTFLGMRFRMPYEPEPTGWFQDDEGRLEMVRGDAPGSVWRQSSVYLDGIEYPIQVRSHAGIEIQLSTEVAAILAGDVPLSTLFRRAGIGRVRKDFSTPLEPNADRVWIQAKLGDALLVLRRNDGPDHAAFFRLGELSQSVRASIFRDQVLFFLADDYLPDARWLRMLQLVHDQRAWGALIASTIDG